jgi:hypothetical protein
MRDTIEPTARTDQLIITFHFTDGEKFTQELSINQIEAAEDVLRWIANAKGSPVYKWRHPEELKVKVVVRSHITFIEIAGYIEPEGSSSKWYQRVADKFRARKIMKQLKSERM